MTTVGELILALMKHPADRRVRMRLDGEGRFAELIIVRRRPDRVRQRQGRPVRRDSKEGVVVTTVGELIFVPGYETGCDDLRPLQVVRLTLDANQDNWNGPHKVTDDGEPAVLISDVRCGGRFRL